MEASSDNRTPVLPALYELAKAYKSRFALISLFALLSTAADLVQPLIYRQAINDVAALFLTPATTNTAKTFEALLVSVLLLFFVNSLGYFFYLRSDLSAARVASRMETDLIVSTFGHVLRLPLSFFSTRSSAGLAKRIDQSDQLSPVVHAFAQQIAPEAIRLVGICAIMFSQNWRMSLVALCLLPPYLWIARRSAIRMKTGLEPYYEMWENISARITGALSAIKTVKLSGAEAREQSRLHLESGSAYDVYLNRIQTSQRFHLAQAILSYLSKSLVLGYGGYLVLQRQMTPGDVIMFTAYLDRLYSPIDSLNNMAVSLQQNAASLARAIALQREGPVEAVGDDLPTGPGQVEFKQVRFSYIPGSEVLKGLNLTLAPGKITALAGPSGAGKTTTADLLLKLFDPDSGDILIDNHSIAQAAPAPVRRAIGVVAADGAVFRGTLAENIRYKRPQASESDILHAAQAAGLTNLLNRLPDGLATQIGDSGVGLSVGERQRLQIARTLVDKPRLLVLDEATANLDYSTELEIKHSLLALNPRPTTLIIAHRYTMMKDADYVYVLDEGRVVEQGTPAELLAASGWFAQLAQQSQVPECPSKTG